MISVKNLSKEFNSQDEKQRVLKNINLHIGYDELITIMGVSGGGKSTLLQIIALLTEPTEGEIYYGDYKVDFKNERYINDYRRNNIGLIFQNANLISCLSPLENLIIAMDTKRSYKEKVMKAKSLLDEVGLSKKYNCNVTSLSGGEAQRVAVVRALVNDPDLILCDEPTGALDSQNSKRVIDLLMKIRNERKCTIIIVTHDREIGELGERKIQLREGKIHEVDNHL